MVAGGEFSFAPGQRFQNQSYFATPQRRTVVNQAELKQASSNYISNTLIWPQCDPTALARTESDRTELTKT
jgi:hypothetical protein